MAPTIEYEHWDGHNWQTDAVIEVSGDVRQVDSTLYVPDDQLPKMDKTLLPHRVEVKKDGNGNVFSRSGSMQELSVQSSGFTLREVKGISELHSVGE